MSFRRFFKPAVSALTMGLLIMSASACGLGGPSKAERLGKDLEAAALSVTGVESAKLNVNMNTSGNFITVKLVGSSHDADVLADVLGNALPPMLEETEELQSGTFGISIFSPDDAVSASARDLGYPGGSSLNSFREYFLSVP
ncbi:hypothetical protein DM791_14285 [Paenarthrobacter nitroguajacolicus]|nr:hypothetical protein [Paenarthrobacter nitroguajacolicus]NWL34057.1 hypothetical protein [Paenarthrobacter nitroguajacolicus]